MKSIILVLTLLTLLTSCKLATRSTKVTAEQVDYEQMVKKYLSANIIRPTQVYNNDGRNEFNLPNHTINWRELDSGIEITVNRHSFSTTDKLTLNQVENAGKDSVNTANLLQQVKVYENESLIGFVLTFYPCTGLSCSVNYQIIYDLKTGKQSYFGRFRTGSEFELYDFNSDGRPDYLSTVTDGPSAEGVISREYVLYSQSKSGEFEEFSTDKQERFWFRHTFNEFQPNTLDVRFEDNWIEKINKNSR